MTRGGRVAARFVGGLGVTGLGSHPKWNRLFYAEAKANLENVFEVHTDHSWFT